MTTTKDNKGSHINTTKDNKGSHIRTTKDNKGQQRTTTTQDLDIIGLFTTDTKNTIPRTGTLLKGPNFPLGSVFLRCRMCTLIQTNTYNRSCLGALVPPRQRLKHLFILCTLIQTNTYNRSCLGALVPPRQRLKHLFIFISLQDYNYCTSPRLSLSSQRV
jgi:hypothetical protein